MPTNSFAVSVKNLGCKINRVESDRMELQLVEAGFDLTDFEHADLIIVNTCAVTGLAEKKTRKEVRKALRQPKSPKVLVTGCASNLDAATYEALGDRVSTIQDKDQIVSYAYSLIGKPTREFKENAYENLKSYQNALSKRRVNIKVQDGCDYRCSYCIVWKARGPARSIEVEDVLQQVSKAADDGIQEVILTGINLGRYSSFYNKKEIFLDGLLELLLSNTTIPRIRLSSIEPQDVTDSLLSVIKNNPERICRHFHVPLQSGSSSVLKRMKRAYDASEFLEIINKIYTVSDDFSISTDIIVGFPGETDEEFQQTVDLVKKVHFTKLHVFRFSSRPGTEAHLRSDHIDPKIISYRSKILRDLSDDLRFNDAQKRISHVEYVLVENNSQGTSESYHTVDVQQSNGDLVESGELVPVKFLSVDTDCTIHGVVVD